MTIHFTPKFENDLKLNTEAPQKWYLRLPANDWKALESGELKTPLKIKIPQGTEEKQIHVMLDVMSCKVTECILKKLSVVYTIVRDADASTNVVENKELKIR